jgi:hypothetical protein
MEALGRDDIASGLLPRFLIFDATDTVAGKRTPLPDRENNDEEYAAKKAALKAILFTIGEGRANGRPLGQDEHGRELFDETQLEFDTDAVERLDLLDEKISRLPPGDEVAAVMGRGFEHVMKLAALFALSRARSRDTTIQLIDVLRAIQLVDATTHDLFEMKDRLGENQHERHVAEVVSMLAASATGSITVANVSKKLKLDARDTAALIGTVVIRKHASSDGQTLEGTGAKKPAHKKALAIAEAIRQADTGALTGTEINVLTQKRGGVDEALQIMMTLFPGEFEIIDVDFPKSRTVRLSDAPTGQLAHSESA